MKRLQSQTGSTLIAVAMTVALFSTLLGVLISQTNNQGHAAHRLLNRAQAVAYGDGVLESLYEQWRTRMLSATTTLDRAEGRTNADLQANLALPTTSNLPRPAGVSVASWSVTAVTPMLSPTTRSDGRPEPEVGTNSRLRARINYLASVTLNYTFMGGTDSVTVERSFVRAGRNLFDNFFFGTQPEVEFHPGPEMFINGTTYVGGNLYTAHNSLRFLAPVNFLGSHTADYRTTDPRFGTAPTIANGGFGDNWDLNNPPRKGVEQKLFDTRADQLEARFLDDPISNDTSIDGNSNNDGYRELLEEPVAGHTDPLQLDPSTSERLSQNADYRIIIAANNTVQIFKGASTTALPASNSEYLAIRNAMVLDQAIRDVRAGDNVRVASMNVGAIKTAFDNGQISDNFGGNDGLLFYVRDSSVGTSVSTKVVNSTTGTSTTVTSTSARGVRLFNGASLPSAGLTVATPNHMYIQGDYNTGLTSTTQPASNTATTYTPPNNNPSPVVSGYQRVAAAVAGDAVNVLSNSWNDANSLTAQSTRVATNTTMNTTIIAGNVPSTSSSYSGGIENFVRFHENWSNRYFTIYGSLALLFNSREANRGWSFADYTPPLRRWYYDTMLLDNNPPGFSVARVYERGNWRMR